MPDIPATRVEHDHFAIVFPGLPTNLREERRKPVVIVLSPPVERMVVALRTLNPHPHEHLGHILRDLQRVRLILIVVRLRNLERSPIRAEQVLHHLVDRNVVPHLLVEPRVVQQHRLVADDVVRPDHQPLGPFAHPDLGEFLPLQQLVNQHVPFVRIAARHERRILFRRRQHTHQVQEHSPHKHFIGTGGRGDNPQLLQLLVDQLIHEVVRHHLRRFILEPLRQHDVLRTHRVRREPRHDERFAPLPGRHQSIRIDRGRVVVVR